MGDVLAASSLPETRLTLGKLNCLITLELNIVGTLASSDLITNKEIFPKGSHYSCDVSLLDEYF